MCHIRPTGMMWSPYYGHDVMGRRQAGAAGGGKAETETEASNGNEAARRKVRQWRREIENAASEVQAMEHVAKPQGTIKHHNSTGVRGELPWRMHFERLKI